MGEIGSNARVQDFSSGTIIAHDTFLNEIQDQLKSILGTRNVGVPMSGGMKLDGSSEWALTDAASPYWVTSGNTGHYLFLPIPGIREGAVITAVHITLHGDNGTGGTINLGYITTAASSGASTTTVLDGSDPWNIAAQAKTSYTGLTTTVPAGDLLFGLYLKATDDAGHISYVYNASVEYHFGAK